MHGSPSIPFSWRSKRTPSALLAWPRRAVALTVTCVILCALLATPGYPAEGRVLTPAMFGARGDGVIDDTVALQRSLDALQPGDTLRVEQGKIYRHSDVLVVRVASVR